MKESYGARIIEHTSKADNWVAVEPLTVCQFTGLTDCKDNEIWEGDIVEFEIYDLYKGNIKIEAVIEYTNSKYVAVAVGIPYSLCTKRIKVVGNKFDKEK